MPYGKEATRVRFALLRDAYNFLHEIPEHNVDLNSICKIADEDRTIDQPGCNTIACGIGWLGLSPKFQKRGLVTNPFTDELTFNGEPVVYPEAAEKLFGIPYGVGQTLFSTAPAGYLGSHKALLLNRIMRYLDEAGEVDEPKYF